MSKLDREEREFLESFERGEWKSIPNFDIERKKFQRAAATTLKIQRIRIQLPLKDLRAIQKRAAKEGVPYEMLITNIVHKYAAGQLVEKRRNARKPRL